MSESHKYQWKVPLVQEGLAGADFKRHNPPGQNFRQVLQLSPGTKTPLCSEVEIVGMAHGKWDQGNDYATVLVLRFHFVSQDAKHRFRWARLTMSFEDAKSKAGSTSGPEPVRTAPERVRYYDQVTVSRESTTGGEVSIGTAGLLPVELKAGGKVELRESKAVDYSIRLTCMPRILKEYGDEADSVIWSLEENAAKMKGIPTFLQTAVLLRRRTNGPFTASLQIECRTDPSDRFRWWGEKLIEEIEDVQVDPGEAQVLNSTFSFTDIGTKDGDVEKAGEKESAVKPVLCMDNLGNLPLEPYFKIEL